MGRGLSLVVILTEGIKGHLNQARGIARWLSVLSGAEVVELQVPRLSGIRKPFQLKIKARFVGKYTSDKCRKWLEDSGGAGLIREFSDLLARNRYRPDNCLILSAGNTPAPYNLALGRMFNARTAVLMSPTATGITPFDFAVVPEHDFPRRGKNVITTLGAPNAVFPCELDERGEELSAEFPKLGSEAWGILIGGDDANYSIDSEWVRTNIGALVDIAAGKKVSLYITTSRRTNTEAENTLCGITEGRKYVRMNLIASKDSRNPVPGILGLCDRIFCTEDSVSMISEAVTSGKEVFLLYVGKKKGLKTSLGRIARFMVKKGLLPAAFLWGPGRFDQMLHRFIEMGFLKEMPPEIGEWGDFLSGEPCSGGRKTGFNEARRSAEWILEEVGR